MYQQLELNVENMQFKGLQTRLEYCSTVENVELCSIATITRRDKESIF